MDKVDVNPKLDLVLEKILDVTPEQVYKAWTDQEGIKNWFCPTPWKTVLCEMDLRPGGKFKTVMKSPEGQEYPGEGCFIELIPNKKIVWTDAINGSLRPNKEPFMTAMLLLEPANSGTKYTAIALHKDEEARKRHEEMGFMQGWGIVADQMVAYIKSHKK